MQIIIDGKRLKFTDYIRDHTRRHYPDVGHKSIMVPPIVFHQNWLITDKKKTMELQGSSVDGTFKDVTVRNVSPCTSRSSVAEYCVAEVFRHLAESLGGPNAVILGSKFENYLNKVKGKLQNVGLATDIKDRGEHDLLFICPKLGLLVISVKSVGSNFDVLGLNTEKRKSVLRDVLSDKAIEQLKAEVKVVEHVLSDLSPPVTCAFAFPNIPREMLASALYGSEALKKACSCDDLLKGDSSSLCLCSEEFPPIDQAARSPAADDINWKERLMDWFSRRCPNPSTGDSKPALNQQEYEDVFGRYCGLLSTVDVTHRRHEGRIEVRSQTEAVSEVSRRFRSLLLLPEQVDLLSSSIPRVFLWGMTGSGKTVMLVLKARHWLNSGWDVILINVSYDAPGSPIAHRLLNDIQESTDGEGEIRLLNVRLSSMNKTDLLQQIQHIRDEMCTTSETSTSGSLSPRDRKPPVHFLLDEVYPKFQPVFEVLLKEFPNSEIWAAGLEKANGPSNFDSFESVEDLRNPPAVQRVLQLSDYDPSRECAEETIGMFSELLGHSQKNSTSCGKEEPTPGVKKTTQKKASIPHTVCLSDVVILCKDPECRRVYLKQEDEIFHLCEDLLRDFVTMLEKSVFVDCLRTGGYPVRVVTSPYSEELALPDQNAVTISWVIPASGLEWAVVLFMPGDPAKESSERSEPLQENVAEVPHHSASLGASPGHASVRGESILSSSSKSRSVLPESAQDLHTTCELSHGPEMCCESVDKLNMSSESSAKVETSSTSVVKTATSPESDVKTATSPESAVKTATSPETAVKPATSSESDVKTATSPESAVKTATSFE
ncbi:hypothetical protein ACOMHN_001762 [Nucella lapillus]